MALRDALDKAFDKGRKDMAIGRDIHRFISDKDRRMPKEEWGVKRLCPNCSMRFYDLQQDPMTCPNCEASFSVDSLTNPKSRPTLPTKEEPVAEKEPEETATEEVVLDDDDDNDAEIGDDLLDDDDEDTVNLEEIADVAADEEEN